MRRLLCLLCALALLASMTSCHKSKSVLSDVKTISEDREWWNETITTISMDDVGEVIHDVPYSVVSSAEAADGDSVVIRFGILSENMNGYTLLRHYSYKGELLGQILLEDSLGSDVQFDMSSSIFKLDGKYCCFISQYDDQDGSSDTCRYELDFDSGSLKDPHEISCPEEKGKEMELWDAVGVEDKLVYLWRQYDGSAYSYLIQVEEDGVVREYVPQFGNNVHVEYIEDLYNYDKGVSFFADVVDNGQAKCMFCTLDTRSLTLNKTEDVHHLQYADFVPNFGFIDKKGFYWRTVSKTDITSGSKTVVADLSNTYLQGLDMNEEVIWAGDDQVVFYSLISDRVGNITPKLTLLMKSDKNPNAGKTLLSLAYLDDVSECVYSAVNDFNRKSEKYFVELNHKYYDMQQDVPESDDSGERSYMAEIANADAVTVLMSDIKDGNGPDLVIYSREAAQLNSTDYLIDLTSRIESQDELKSGDYMDFIRQPNGRDGKHYRLDYCFNSMGFIINNSFIDNGARGLTFDEYERVIQDKHNNMGVFFDDDLMKLKYLLTTSDCFSFNKEGKIDLGSGDFRKVAEYIASVPEGSANNIFSGFPVDGIQMSANMSFMWYWECCMQFYGNYSIIGLHSADGHAETIFGRGLGITSCCPSKDGAWEFILEMLSPEIQNQLCLDYTDPVSKSALHDTAVKFIEDYNSQPDPYGYSMGPVSKDIVDRYIDQISDAVLVPDLDSSILVIVNEEMPAYFQGDKSLDEVISILENRINLMLAEREAVK